MTPEPEDFEIRSSRGQAFKMLVLMPLCFVFIVAPFGAILGKVREDFGETVSTVVGLVLSILLLCVAIGFLIKLVPFLFSNKLLLIVSRRGITDCNHSMDSLIPWEYVTGICVPPGHPRRRVGITVLRFDAYLTACERATGKRPKFELEEIIQREEMNVLLRTGLAREKSAELVERLCRYRQALVPSVPVAALASEPVPGPSPDPIARVPEPTEGKGAKGEAHGA